MRPEKLQGTSGRICAPRVHNEKAKGEMCSPRRRDTR
jgi:hypothetical protein